MLTLIPTKYAAGVTLYGDYQDLTALHEVIHDVVNSAPHDEPLKDMVFGLAYEVRKAYEMQRDETVLGFDEFDQVKYRGSKLLWPYLIVQTRLLRDMASYVPSTKIIQAQLYLLEHGIEESLNAINPEVAHHVIDWLNRPFSINGDYYLLYVDEITKQYIVGPQGKARIKKLPKLLKSLYHNTDEYMAFAAELEAQAAKHGCSPYELRANSDWPEFKW